MNFDAEDDDGFVVQSIEPLYLGRVNGSHPTQAAKRISIREFSVPKFTMRLAANQGNPKQLAALLAAKQMKKKTGFCDLNLRIGQMLYPRKKCQLL